MGKGGQCTLGNATGKVLKAASLLMHSEIGEGPRGVDIQHSC